MLHDTWIQVHAAVQAAAALGIALLPALSSGEWYRGEWTGAVLKGDPDASTIEKFLDEAIAAVR